MSSIQNKRIVVGVTGGIAAYKAPDLVRRLRERGAEVRVVMSHGATEFITALTLQAVSGNEVHDSLLDHRAESGMGHIELARWADLVLIAPTSAHFLAKLANGLADDLLSTIYLATEAQVAVAPSMNRIMWSHVATTRNLSQLQADGVSIIGPDSGDQACGEDGQGRMTEPTEITNIVASLFETSHLGGQHVMITAGPTWEALDPVRGLTNLSSGKMGYAIAQAAVAAGAKVSLVSGPCNLATPPGCDRIDVVSATEMYDAVHSRIHDVDIFIGVAAVADYRPVTVASQKIKKKDASLTVEFTRNPDIVASVSALPNRPYTVGFAAETEEVVAHARKKLMNKNLDLICANQVGGAEGGFATDENAITLIDRYSTEQLPMSRKDQLGVQLIKAISQRIIDAENSTQDPGQSSR